MLEKKELKDKNNIDIKNIVPWNSKEFPVKINSIRYNQDNTLFTLATSRGYKIFSTKNLLQVQEETNTVRDFGDLNIVMTYYSSSLVFFNFTENNDKFTTKELILYDDFSEKILSSFKSKKEDIKNFYVGKYSLFIVLETQMLILELITFKIINIISNIYSDSKLCSFNQYGFAAFTKINEKYNVYIKVLNMDKSKIISIRNRCLKPNFEYIQSLQLSPSGQFLALSSMFGNKIHIYYVENLILKECFYMGNEINDIKKMSFPGFGEEFLIVQVNRKKFKIYKFSNIIEGQYKCYCYKYKNENMIKEVIKKKENEAGWFNYIKNTYFGFNFNSKINIDKKEINYDIIAIEVNSGILFLDFVENDIFNKNNINKEKEVVIINEKGFYYKFRLIIDKNSYYNDMEFNLKESVQWI